MDLEVIGRHALLFDDDTTSAFVNSREALVPWIHDSSLFIDRYDVRHLLDRIPSRKLHARSAPEEPSRSELDLERYLDLPPPDHHTDGDGDDSLLDDTSKPPTEKLHQIISRTALFVSEHGGQSEIILRVKQGNNPTFGFLMPDHHLHAYYRFLVDHPELLKADDHSKAPNEKSSDSEGNQTHVPATGALSLLGSVYGSGEDDDMALQVDCNPMEIQSSSVAASETAGSSVCLASKDNVASKNQAALIVKDKTFSLRKKNSINTASTSDVSKKRRKDENASHDSISRSKVSETAVPSDKAIVLEPPSFLKRVIEKIVEFIRRNGKDFEAVLIEQDKANGRFPFLLPTNQYHPYYLKVLQGASESNVRGSSVKVIAGSNKDTQAAERHSTDYKLKTSQEPEGWYYDSSRKEKFKMVISAPKKDGHDQDSKPVKPSGVTPDEAAAIVLAATRGTSPANVFSNKHVNDLGTPSNGSFSSLNGDSLVSKPVSTSDTSNTGQIGSGCVRKIDSVDVAKTIAKSAVLAASNEADSSEVSLSKEQKLKAERLKRAKIFAAMIKSGQEPITELIQAPTTTHLNLSDAKSDPVQREREGSSVPSNSEISDVNKSSRRDSSALEHDKEHRSLRKRSSRSRAEETDSEEDRRHSRKKHHSESSSHKHHKRRSSKESRRHRHHHHVSSEDEHRYRKHSKSRRRHENGELSDTDDHERKRSTKHRGATHAHCYTEVPATEVEKTNDNLPKEPMEVGGTDGSNVEPSVDTEIPSELRAKVRNMLLEIM